MKKIGGLILAILAIIVGLTVIMNGLPESESNGETSVLGLVGVYFSPDGVCQEQVLYWVNQANYTLDIMMFSFTDDEIGDAVMDAGLEGVDVRIIFEKSQLSKYSEYWRLRDKINILVRNDTNSGYMHHKVAIIDSHILLIGSYNWSVSAQERNNENLVIIDNSEMVLLFMDEFKELWSESV